MAAVGPTFGDEFRWRQKKHAEADGEWSADGDWSIWVVLCCLVSGVMESLCCGVNWRIFWKVKAIENGFQLDGTLPSRLIYEMLPDEIFGGS